MTFFTRSFWFALVTAVALSATAADIGPNEALRLRQQGEILALESLLDIALSRYPGARLLEAELEKDDGIFIYPSKYIKVPDGTDQGDSPF